MTQPIKITVTANTAQAMSAMTSFVGQSQVGLAQLSTVAQQAGTHMAGMSYRFRSAMDAIRFASTGNTIAAFYTLDEAVRALVASGKGLSEIAPMIAEIGAVGAVIAGGIALWHHYADAEKEAAQAAKEHAAALREIPKILSDIEANVKSGFTSPQSALDYIEYLSGRKKLYKNSHGQLQQESTEQIEIQNTVATPYGPMPAAGSTLRTANLEPATQDEVNQWVKEQQMIAARTEAKIKAAELDKQLRLEALDGLEKEIATIHAKYEKQRDEITKTHDLEIATGAITKGGEADKRFQADLTLSKQAEAKEIANAQIENANKDAQAFLRQSELNQQSALATVEQQNKSLEARLTLDAAQAGKTREANYAHEVQAHEALLLQQRNAGLISEQQYTDQIKEQEAKRLEGLNREKEVLERIAQLKAQMSQRDYEAERRGIEQNPLLTDAQKIAQLQRINAVQLAQLEVDMTENQSTQSTEIDPAKRLKLLEQERTLRAQINELEAEQQKLQFQNADAVTKIRMGYAVLMGEYSNWQQNVANVALSPFVGLNKGLDTAFNDLFTKGTSIKQFFNTVGLSIANSFSHAVSKMLADWITSHALMLAKEAATQAGITSIFASHTAARTGIHAAGEGTQTAVSAQHTLARNALQFLETSWHAIQATARVAIHLGAEFAMTMITVAQSLLRRIAAFLEAQPYIFLAAVKAAAAVADIPYVGPILAPIAAASTFAALEAMAAFEKGDYTGGRRGEVAGLVHGEEFVFSAPAVDAIGLQPLRELHQSALSGRAPALSGIGQPLGNKNNTEIHLHLHDDRSAALKAARENPDWHNFIADISRRTVERISPAQ